MNREDALSLLRAVAAGELSPASAADRLALAPLAELGFASVDHHRALRDGLPEVIYSPGKTPEQVGQIAAEVYGRSGRVIATRIDDAQAGAFAAAIAGATHDRHARLAWADRSPRPPGGHVAIVTAGTSDIPVAEEAAITATMAGAKVTRHFDIGVAGLHRLGPHLEAIRAANALVVVAGMDGALPSVIGGLVANPVIAVPTSTGYGAAFGGVAALLTMLNSCAAGVSVVNIDNGFGAGYIAAAVNRLAVDAGNRR
jgi:hypothetical protein